MKKPTLLSSFSYVPVVSLIMFSYAQLFGKMSVTIPSHQFLLYSMERNEEIEICSRFSSKLFHFAQINIFSQMERDIRFTSVISGKN